MSEQIAEQDPGVKEVPKVLEEIRKNIKTKNLVVGTDRTIKMLKTGKLARVFLASNTKKETEQDIRHYTSISGVEIVKLDMPNEELGIFCKRPYAISVIGLVK